MIPYKIPEEKETLLFYAKLLGDRKSEAIIVRNSIENKQEAVHFAEFFWGMVRESNKQDEISGESSEYIFEKLIITLMGYFRSSGYEEEWEEVLNRN
ncbi:hypothetical protein [Microbulbifer sp.]|uniref:hypothetical protein n=1 Tax=Microbulbifer sp. TaxID=1908541 RepID=UPI003F321089